MDLIFPGDLLYGLITTTHQPPHTSSLMLPYADAVTNEGNFGTIIKQRIFGDEYTIYLHIFQLNTPIKLDLLITTPIITLTYTLQGSPSIADDPVPDGTYALFYFPAERHPLQLEAGQHIIVHIQLKPSILQWLACKYFPVFDVCNALDERHPASIRHNGYINAPVWELLNHMLLCKLEEEERAMYQHARILDLLLMYAEDLAEEGYKDSGSRFHFSPEDIKAILQAGEWKFERLDESLHLKDIARKVNLHPQKMRAGFKLVFGELASKMAIDKKIEKAKRLLRDTDMSLESIAFETGYSNTSAFIRAFRRETGITPANYRK